MNLKTFKDGDHNLHQVDTMATCDCCGQTLYYEVTLSIGLADTLRVIVEEIKAKGINIVNTRKELYDLGKITLTQYNNMTHLARLGMLANVNDEVGNYCLTAKAIKFLRGEPVPKGALVKKSSSLQHSNTAFTTEETTTLKDIYKAGGYWEVPGFDIREGRVIKAEPGAQGQLFKVNRTIY